VPILTIGLRTLPNLICKSVHGSVASFWPLQASCWPLLLYALTLGHDFGLRACPSRCYSRPCQLPFAPRESRLHTHYWSTCWTHSQAGSTHTDPSSSWRNQTQFCPAQIDRRSAWRLTACPTGSTLSSDASLMTFSLLLTTYGWTCLL